MTFAIFIVSLLTAVFLFSKACPVVVADDSTTPTSVAQQPSVATPLVETAGPRISKKETTKLNSMSRSKIKYGGLSIVSSVVPVPTPGSQAMSPEARAMRGPATLGAFVPGMDSRPTDNVAKLNSAPSGLAMSVPTGPATVGGGMNSSGGAMQPAVNVGFIRSK